MTTSLGQKRQYEFRPTGRLHLRIVNVNLLGARQVWSDKKNDRIEDHVGEFVASVAVAGERQRLDRIEAEKRRQQEIALARRNRAIELHNDAYEALEADARERLTDWRFATDLRGLAAAVHAHAVAAGNPIDPESQVGLWMEWSECAVRYYEQQATSLDTLRKGESAYALAYRFSGSHKVTMNDALRLFLKPIDDLVREEVERERTPSEE